MNEIDCAGKMSWWFKPLMVS